MNKKRIVKANYPCDLHSHSTLSDGGDTPYELVENALARGLEVLALTDHDRLPPMSVEMPGGKPPRPLVHWAAGRGLCLLRGVEFSCESGIEDVHIVGLGCHWESPAMEKIESEIAKSKAEAYYETINRLRQRGYEITWEEVLTFNGQTVQPEELQKKRIFDVIAAKGYTKNWSEAKLLVRDDPFLRVPRQKPPAQAIIKAIHTAGGIAILAHPYLIDSEVEYHDEKMPRWAFIERLIAGGLDGIETRYTYNKTTCKDNRSPCQIWQEVIENADGRLLLSAGSDYHADGKKHVENPRELGECGLTMEEFLSVPFFNEMHYSIMGT